MKWVDHPSRASDPKPAEGSPGTQTPGAWSSEPSTDNDLVPVDPTPQHFRVVRAMLLGEGLVLLIMGLWGTIAAVLGHTTDNPGATVLVIHITLGYGIILTVTALLALLSTLKYRAAFWFTMLQFVVYLVLFISTTGTNSWLSVGAGDAFLNAALGLVGLGLLFWISPLALGGMHWVHRSELRRPGRTRRQGWN